MNYLSCMEGANRRHIRAGRPRMLGIRVVSLAIIFEPAALTLNAADTCKITCIVSCRNTEIPVIVY